MMKDGKGHTRKGAGGAGGAKKHGGKAGVEKPKKTSQRDRIRILKHLLKKEDLVGPARERAERELAELSAAQQKIKLSEKERKLAVRYHKVRFFERVKVERRIARLERQAAENSSGLTEAEQQELQQCNADLEYIKHFPPGEKYVSLLKNAATPEDQAHLAAERGRLRALAAARAAAAAQAAADIAALTQADEGLGSNGAPAQLPAAKSKPDSAKLKPNKPDAASIAPVKLAPGKAIDPSGREPVKAAVTAKAALQTSHATGAGSLNAAVAASGGDDDFFLSDDEEEDQAAGVGAAGKQGPAQPVVARAWPKVEGDSDDSGDDDNEEEEEQKQEVGVSRGARTGGKQQIGKQGVGGGKGGPGSGHSNADGAGTGDNQKRRRRSSGTAQQAAPGGPRGKTSSQGEQQQEHDGEGGHKRKRRRKRSGKTE